MKKKHWIIIGASVLAIGLAGFIYTVYKKRKTGVKEAEKEKEKELPKTFSTKPASAPVKVTAKKAVAKIVTSKVAAPKPVSDDYKNWMKGIKLYASKDGVLGQSSGINKTFNKNQFIGTYDTLLASRQKIDVRVKLDGNYYLFNVNDVKSTNS